MNRGATRVLILCSHEFERTWLGEVLRRHGVRVWQAATWREGSGSFRDCRPHAVICEADLPDAGWKEVLKRISRLKNAPRLIVISSQAGESLWAEVLNLGGYDLLPMPLVEDEVVWAVGWLGITSSVGGTDGGSLLGRFEKRRVAIE